MALQGKFLVNDAPFSPLAICGVGTFSAFSGNGIYRNRGGCTAIPDNGPIPSGRYWIVDRPKGGVGSQAWTWTKDAWNTVTGIPSHHSEWFALYRDDDKIDDFTWVKGIERGHFRLHPAGGRGISLGCITLPSYADFARIRQALLHTPAVSARNSGLRAYGTIEVIAYGDTCP
ncbi:DUF2778 domain-containing protein [Paraburkholderia guartelaensis]|uniref:DUF2778 domain-containing protein n=1 Tax=Paraburkholderia guartelaensis TaxID=2546446 RepID=A0A4R5LKV1_9BURK|nr:DUF2778 domain-containing protein [Paraburkholderia guartelaensis]TDG10382.1 DUF2778 domain-containing protein [Paraburkholderia guartelaensis]